MKSFRTIVLTSLTVVAVLLPQTVAAQERHMMYGDTTRVGVPYCKDPYVVKFGGRYLMYYSIPCRNWDYKHSQWGMGIAESQNLIDWHKVGELTTEMGLTPFNSSLCATGGIVRNDTLHLFYQSYGGERYEAICHAWSTDGIHFTPDPTNPVFHPTGDWNCGRAIDADVYKFKGKYFMYFATRDPAFKIQMQGVATAPEGTDFSRGQWKMVADSSILRPVLPWEGQCIEGASVVRHGKKLYMFYAGAYNNAPQQVGVAVSKDGVKWERLSDQPFVPNGKPGEWNSSESGHPCIFKDSDGHTYLFYQGNNDNGKTWLITQREVRWKKGRPLLKP